MSNPRNEKQSAPIRPIKGDIVGTAAARPTEATTSMDLRTNEKFLIEKFLETSHIQYSKREKVNLHLVYITLLYNWLELAEL